MKFIIAQDSGEMSAAGANIIIDHIKKKPSTVLGLATGSTPIAMYRILIDAHHKGLDFSKVITFNLDEYYGLPSNHPQSYNYFMHRNLFDHINIPESNIHIPNGLCDNPKKECENYDLLIDKAGGIDLQVLGIGRNGHIGFNEPGKSLYLKTHLTELAEETINANSRFFGPNEQVPRKAITMGIGNIMKAKKIILLACGKDKAQAVQGLSQCVVDTRLPASLLHLHPDTLVIVDKEAASLLLLDNTF